MNSEPVKVTEPRKISDDMARPTLENDAATMSGGPAQHPLNHHYNTQHTLSTSQNTLRLRLRFREKKKTTRTGTSDDRRGCIIKNFVGYGTKPGGAGRGRTMSSRQQACRYAKKQREENVSGVCNGGRGWIMRGRETGRGGRVQGRWRGS